MIIIYPITEGRLGTTDDFTTSFLHFSLFSTALWDLVNSRPVHSLMLSSHLFLCLPCLLPPFTVPCETVLARPDEQETWPYHCSLRLFMMVRRSSCGQQLDRLATTGLYSIARWYPAVHTAGLYSLVRWYTVVHSAACKGRYSRFVHFSKMVQCHPFWS